MAFFSESVVSVLLGVLSTFAFEPGKLLNLIRSNRFGMSESQVRGYFLSIMNKFLGMPFSSGAFFKYSNPSLEFFR